MLSSGLWALAAMMGEHVVGPCSSSAFRRSVVLLLLLVTMATGSILKNDPECLQLGGICVTASSCPDDKRVNKTAGLCSLQEEDGACCNSVPTDIEDCRLRGGGCRNETQCKSFLNFGQLNCEEGSSCCLLIY